MAAALEGFSTTLGHHSKRGPWRLTGFNQERTADPRIIVLRSSLLASSPLPCMESSSPHVSTSALPNHTLVSTVSPVWRLGKLMCIVLLQSLLTRSTSSLPDRGLLDKSQPQALSITRSASLTHTHRHTCTRAHVTSHSFVSVVSRDGQLSRTRLASTRVTPRDALSGAEQQVDLHTSPSNCALCRRPQGAGHVTKTDHFHRFTDVLGLLVYLGWSLFYYFYSLLYWGAGAGVTIKRTPYPHPVQSERLLRKETSVLGRSSLDTHG